MGLFSATRDHGGPRYDLHRPWVLTAYKSGGGKWKQIHFFSTQAAAARALRHELSGEGMARIGHRWVWLVSHVTSQRDLNYLSDASMSRSRYDALANKQLTVEMRRRIRPQAKETSMKHTHADWKGYKVVHMTDIRLHNNAGIGMPVCKAGARMLDMDATGLKQTSDFSKVTCAKCRARHPKRYPWAVRHGREALVEEAHKARHGSRSRGYGSAELETGKFYAYKGHRVWLDAVPGGYFAMVEGTALQARGSTQGEALKRLREKLDAGAANYRRRKARRR